MIRAFLFTHFLLQNVASSFDYPELDLSPSYISRSPYSLQDRKNAFERAQSEDREETRWSSGRRLGLCRPAPCSGTLGLRCVWGRGKAARPGKLLHSHAPDPLIQWEYTKICSRNVARPVVLPCDAGGWILDLLHVKHAPHHRASYTSSLSYQKINE